MLVAGALVDSFGNGLFLAASTLYFVGVLRFPAAQVATTLSVAAIFGLLSPLPLGHVADRWGVVRTYVALMCLRGAGFAAYALIHGFAGYAVLTCALLAAERACSPLLQVIVSGVAGQEERTRTLASIRAVRNAGLTGGLLVAGLVLGLHVTAAFRAVFLVDAVSFLVIAWMALWAVRASDGIPTAPAADVRSGAAPYRDPRFMVFTVSNGVLSLFDSLIVVLLPIWVVQRTELPHAWLSLLLAVNTVLTVLLQAWVHRFATSVDGSVRLLRATALSLVVGCGLFAVAERVPVWVCLVCTIGAVVAVTVGENLQSVAGWELSYVLSPAAARARYLATFSMGMTAQRIVGPTLLVSALLPLGSWAWVVLAALFAAASVGAVWSGRPVAGPVAEGTPADGPVVVAVPADGRAAEGAPADGAAPAGGGRAAAERAASHPK
ncbi:MFS transporter [Kitasatospora sp. CM 4170]|uniref:MFS transporter n=1 Tax=Kitasatospora aburaviensis TaxID=67265 RepID=A0ABW1EN07_9ACTN|nr:MFS transporter [Kitasatospora sp. CM 4170]WNM48410.1 MFS transporter [Kitasatospora sp. CM 4170]